jgi:hypothetical protein
MKKKFGLAYYSIGKKHLCVSLGSNNYKDLTTGEEFIEQDDNAIRSVMPEDLLDSTILVELGDKEHYIRISYCEVATSKKISDLITIDVDPSGRLVGIKLGYPFPTK